MTLHAAVFPEGTRVRVRAGRLPMVPELPGRVGTVVGTDEYRPRHYAVLLDGESEAREFAQDELEAA
ncbi:MAG TPA: hypothetical protein VK858_11615 [Longimicrobiales bacterium]|nr:hypothetical protein [Longimicrobiales bacterium]